MTLPNITVLKLDFPSYIYGSILIKGIKLGMSTMQQQIFVEGIAGTSLQAIDSDVGPAFDDIESLDQQKHSICNHSGKLKDGIVHHFTNSLTGVSNPIQAVSSLEMFVSFKRKDI